MNLEKENLQIERQFIEFSKTIIRYKNNDGLYHKLIFTSYQLIDYKDYSVFPNSTEVLRDQFRPLNSIK